MENNNNSNSCAITGGGASLALRPLEAHLKLSEGVWTNKMLADWFDIKYNSFAKCKAKKLEELKEYCDFEEDKGKIIITKVKKSGYSKKYDIVKEHIDECWSKDGLDSCSRVSAEIVDRFRDILGEKITGGTVYEYTRKGRNELYGRPFCGWGELGRSEYVLCKRVSGKGKDARYELFTKDEELKKRELLQKYFGSASEKTLFIKNMIDKGELREEDAWKVYEEMIDLDHNFKAFIDELSLYTKCTIIRGTLVDRKSNYDERDLRGV